MPASPRVVFVNSRDKAPKPRAGTRVVVLDMGWTPPPGERADLVAIRPVVEEIVRRDNLFDESLDRLDAWAEETATADRFTVDGVTFWFHARSFLRLTVHELLLWRHIIDAVAPADPPVTLVVSGDRPLLAAAASAPRRTGPRQRVRVKGLSPERRRQLRRIGRGIRQWGGGIYRQLLLPRRATRKRREAFLDARVRDLTGTGRVLAVMRAESFHTVRTDSAQRRGDPYVDPVLARLADEGIGAVKVVLGMAHWRDADWPAIEADPELLPWTYVQERWRPPEHLQNPIEALQGRLDGIAAAPLLVGDVDLGPIVGAEVTRQGGWLRPQTVAMGTARNLIGELRPTALFTGWEAARTAWLGAARAHGVPIVAVQHGVIYPKTPDYVRPFHASHVLSDLTCTFGPYERDLLIRDGGYPAGAVLATGSPRVTPEGAVSPVTEDERAAVRRRLGVRDGDRVLVVSTARNSVGDAFHGMAMAGRLLGGPLPGVHVVFKLHPEESNGAHYVALLAGMAAAGGYEPPAMSVIRDIDVYRLLRASDAHLGQYSTVLTDAVLTTTPNMIAVGQAWADIIGYVDAGVAVPVASVDDVRAFMGDPRPPSPEARERFLAAHSLGGDAVGRISDAIKGVMRA